MDRFLLKEFAKTPTIQTGVYGSEQQGSPTYSEDYETIQSLTAWEEGIGGATSNATQQPAINDDQGVYKVLCKSIKNGQISGIPLYLATETYQKGSIVSILDGNDKPIIYYSLTNNNINNNPLTDGGINWLNYDNNFVVLDGSNADFSNLSATAKTNLANDFTKIDGSNATFSSLSTTAKTNIANTGIPDYTQGQSVTSGWTATSNGFIYSANTSLHNQRAYLYVNGVIVGEMFGGATVQDATCAYAIVKKGDVITYSNMGSVIFFPFINNI